MLAEIDPALRAAAARCARPACRRGGRAVDAGPAAPPSWCEAVTAEAAGLGDGRLGRDRARRPGGRAGRGGHAALPEAAVGEHPELESRVVVLTVRQAKGLEFDSVLVVDPAGSWPSRRAGTATSTSR